MMQLRELIDGTSLCIVHGDGGIDIADLTDDSRKVSPGCLFIARGDGGTDGAAYIADAIARGAAAILADGDAAARAIGAPVTWVTAPKVDQALCGRLAERFWRNPSRRLKVIGITGTNGKTTTAFLIQHLLNMTGVKCGLIGTVVNDDGRSRSAAELTTPGAIDFSRLLASMVRHGCEAVVAELSSHALHQGRTAALKVDVAVFTNLTGDHLDYHKTMEDYAAAKAILFRGLSPQGFAVVNADDGYAARMLGECRSRVLPCRVTDAERDCEGAAEGVAGGGGDESACRARIISLGSAKSRVMMDGPWGSIDVRLPLVGRHNVYNALQATAAANCVISNSRGLREALEQCPAPPGRLEPVRVEDAAGAAPAVLVDYAHTHDALENVLAALRPLTRGRLIVLFGCGGDRDKSKRPKMARVACTLADRVIITSDNPRTEDPAAIIDDILAGVPQGCGDEVIVEADRAKAIAAAIEGAGPDDVVLLAGKGHEDYQIIGKEKRHFDDREQAAAALMQWQSQPVSGAA